MSRFNRLSLYFTRYVQELFSLKTSTDYTGTIEQIREGVEFRNGNVWSLVFAILIASVGLNTNSPAVIIGAMLISPLMGPIVGIGFGLGTNNFSILRRSLRNLLIATVVSLVASTLYFSLSPLADVQSELLARTRPTLYDVLIAFFGGCAGIIASSRTTTKTNVLSGVAIATALMPPLCTAGFGLANGDPQFFIGAMHLFLINALFICLATFLFVRILNFHTYEVDQAHLLRTHIILALLVSSIAIPSVLTGVHVVREARFNESAKHFIEEEIAERGEGFIVVKSHIAYDSKDPKISVTVLGKAVTPELTERLNRKKATYRLQNASLRIIQPSQEELPQQKFESDIVNQLVAVREKDLTGKDMRIDSLRRENERLKSGELTIQPVIPELAILFPQLQSISCGPFFSLNKQEKSQQFVVTAAWNGDVLQETITQFEHYFSLKMGGKTVRFIHSKE